MRPDGPPAPAAGDGGERLNVLMLYDEQSVFTNTVRDHLDALARYSRHRVYYAHAVNGAPLAVPLDYFDVVAIHYAVRVALGWHLSLACAQALEAYRGLKVLFVQDEYDNTWLASRWINRLGIDLVFTCVPPEHVPRIYSRVDRRRTAFVPTLTGYLPLGIDPARGQRPPAERPVAIGYRGRELPFRYGKLAREKMLIGQGMRAACSRRGVPCDIESAEQRRIYG